MKAIDYIITFVLVTAATATSCAVAFSTNQDAASAAAANRVALSRRNILDGVVSVATSTIVVLSSPSLAMAQEKNTVLSQINGIYTDPNHLEGYRAIQTLDKSNALIILQDSTNGPVIMVNGKVADTSITLDFSPKGGPKDIVATIVGDDKLRFSDGNTWTKISEGMGGIYSDPNHPLGFRVVRTDKGGKNIFITLQDEPNGEVIELKGKQRGDGSVSIDFSPKGGPNNLIATIKDGGQLLVFPDGNAWTKL